MDDLHDRVKAHAKKYKTFDPDRCLMWFNRHSAEWQEDHRHLAITALNKLKRWESTTSWHASALNLMHQQPMNSNGSAEIMQQERTIPPIPQQQRLQANRSFASSCIKRSRHVGSSIDRSSLSGVANGIFLAIAHWRV